MTLGQRVRMILEERELRQVDFARELGISANYASLIVNDKKDTISDTLAKLIEERYGYSARWILDGTGEKRSAKELTAGKAEIIKKIQNMSDCEAMAVLAFIQTMEHLKNGEIKA